MEHLHKEKAARVQQTAAKVALWENAGFREAHDWFAFDATDVQE